MAFLVGRLEDAYADKFGRLDDFTDACANLSMAHLTPNAGALMTKANRLTATAWALMNDPAASAAALADTYDAYLEHQRALDRLGVGTGAVPDNNTWVADMALRKE